MSAYAQYAENCDIFVSGEMAARDVRAVDAVFSFSEFERALRAIQNWEGYQPTPLVSLPGAAERAGVAQVLYKDESQRFGLKSFKALGGAYAVQCVLSDLVEQKTGTRATIDDLQSGRFAEITQDYRVACATDGNHGRSVAWGAQRMGCRCTIFLHEDVTASRQAAVEAFGADVVRVKGTYDHSVAAAAKMAQQHGWTIISDTSYPGYSEVPKLVMEGYRVLVEEIVGNRSDETDFTHVFVQGGVGGLAAAVTAHLVQAGLAGDIRFTMVEPANAACLMRSAKNSTPTRFEGDLKTIMAGLSCGEVSQLVWPIVQNWYSAFMFVPDELAEELMRDLATGALGPVLTAGESAVAGLAGFLIAASHPEWRPALGLDQESRILVIGSEGDTDPEGYQKIVNHQC